VTNKRGRGVILNRTETADHFGIAMTTLDDWVRRDCPVLQRGARGRPWQFNTADLMKWREADIRAQSQGVQSASADELKRRKLEAETEMAELDLAKAKDLVAPIEQIERALSKAFGEVRANLRNVVPGRTARRLVGETNQTKIKAMLLEEIDQALKALADDDLINETDLELAEEDEDED